MTRYIILIITALLIVSCNTKSIVNSAASTNKGLKTSIVNSAASTKVYTKSIKVTNIPIECYDDKGHFDSNRGHDALDCDNL